MSLIIHKAYGLSPRLKERVERIRDSLDRPLQIRHQPITIAGMVRDLRSLARGYGLREWTDDRPREDEETGGARAEG
jgi:hypothetical protein